MEYRNFKDVKIAEVGLGTWQLGSADWGAVNQEDAFKILKAYTDNGGNFIDTADVYGMGVSEKTIGSFLKTQNKDIYVATKLGRRGDANGWPPKYTYDLLKSHVEDSLTNLDLPQLFLEQLHCIPTEEMRSGTVFNHLRALQQQGLIKHFGASVETSEEALICLEQEGLASLQIIFNLFRQHVADEVFAKAKEKNVAIIVRVPLASGLLSGKFEEKTHFALNDHRNFNANGEAFNAGETFSGIDFKEGVRLANKIKGMLPDSRMPQWAIRWILDHPEVTTVIPGASRVTQVYANVEASDLKNLSPETHQELRKLYDEEIQHEIRGHY
ncbi:aryl-alcohol dehydrogenase-like predicted oxidoreductase [Mucilaginibacter gracilis]|uniref:Aryl-alcohol dehydrogenase-like predicted oxidoreductase n=1 Tax=Mucilaginibacter gracilis TaxID=423350 RepID=A0A495J1E3_9SPHI|nr:aldo/keto reductase [Mucilaginibacter gracilis]RKR82757.1 aryl-alcohol dehydrogenase-like predicted oxidoreductase [Mucilaginibacter gracilis]